MYFPREYFYDEVREGFYINGMVKREWAAQLEVLSEIDRVCKTHGIKWFADCGTLLGAVRHGGYVPWDDDLDICMLRDDYRKFHRFAVKDLPRNFNVMTYECGDYWQMITRVNNRDSISYDEEELGRYHQFPYVAGIDIFVLDYVAPDMDEEEIRRTLVNNVLGVGSYDGIDSDDPPQEGMDLIRVIEEQCNVKLDRKNNLRQQLYQLAERLSLMYPSEGAQEVVLMPYWCTHHNHKYPAYLVNEIVQLPFENTMINVPAGYDEVLKIEYGDYLRIVRKGGMHEYPLYGNQEDFLTKGMEGGNPYRYNFCFDDLAKNREPRPQRLKEQVFEFCGILNKVHSAIRNAAESNREAIIDLLEQCQEGAIRIGTQIEEMEGEGFITVKYIEDYCEKLYEVGEAITEEERFYAALNDLELSFNRVLQSTEHDLSMRKEILFLPFRADLWYLMDPIYRELSEDANNIVYVMPIPYFDRTGGGALAEIHCEIKDYPKDLKLLDYRKNDIRHMHPDVIYTQNAYDRYNYTYVLSPEFFTSELKKYTEELVYVPYFRIGAFNWDDEKLIKTADYFVKIPGVVHADRVLVESEQMKELYVKALIEFAGEDTENIWREKIEVRKPSDEEKPVSYEIYPVEWQEHLFAAGGKKKKAVLFLNAVCSIYQYQKSFLRKLREILKVFYEHREEVVLIWRQHPSLAGAAHLFDREQWLEYREIVEGYRMEGWGILDETEDAALAVSVADAYYGDPDPVMQRCRVMGKPVMILNPAVTENEA